MLNFIRTPPLSKHNHRIIPIRIKKHRSTIINKTLESTTRSRRNGAIINRRGHIAFRARPSCRFVIVVQQWRRPGTSLLRAGSFRFAGLMKQCEYCVFVCALYMKFRVHFVVCYQNGRFACCVCDLVVFRVGFLCGVFFC